ncbi:uncharacterized protein LOC125031653 [Penaeus chinensis]|uniref:uncharacterized protein LOC125031653 n=1 Tax=Penaeus chinensis TaxID=139456 RepID=UPI001FB727A8|nr:uncharacterized protein LOC125031653 [Penaeus chinensis]
MHLQIFNIYRPPRDSAKLKIDHIFAAVENAPSVLCGDFNAHLIIWNDPTSNSVNRTCRTGQYLAHLLHSFPNVSLLNSKTQTHISHLLSSLELIDEWSSTYTPAEDLDSLEADIVKAIHDVANVSIPVITSIPYTRKNKWFHNDRIRELKHRLLQLRKALKQHPSPTLLENYRAAIRLIKAEIREIRSKAWLQWCEFINAHTSLQYLWKKINIAAGKYKKQPCHPHAQEIAEDLIKTFKERGDSNMLSPSTIGKLTSLKPERLENITLSINKVSETDKPFALNEMQAAIKSGIDTAPGIDKISYSMIKHLGPQATQLLLLLFNKSLEAGLLHKAWKVSDIQPIPKAGAEKAFRTISLLSCHSKTMEKAILRRLRFLTPRRHKHSFAYCKGFGTRDNPATVYSLTDGKDSIIVFIDLEKAFELANREAISSTQEE